MCHDPIGNRTDYADRVNELDWDYFTNELNQYHRLATVSLDAAQGLRYDEDGNLVEQVARGTAGGVAGWHA